MTDSHYIGRFAPSPSGELHFGSLIAALGSYLQARARNGIWRVRIEDIDPPREVPGAADAILRQLEHYGLHWNGEVLWQSRRHEAYREALAWLYDQGLSYYCTCTRARIQSIGGIYDGHCRELCNGPQQAAVRIKQQHPVTRFYDRLRGEIQADERLAREDFIIHRRDGLFAYNLAVVVDDHFQGVTEIVRGAALSWTAYRSGMAGVAGGATAPSRRDPLAAHSGAGIGIRKSAILKCLLLSYD